MVEREVTVEVTVQYVVKVIADSTTEARKGAIQRVAMGIATPSHVETAVLDAQDITTTEEATK